MGFKEFPRPLCVTIGGKAKSIGCGIAAAYAKEGANLTLTRRNDQELMDAAVPRGGDRNGILFEQQ